MQPVHEASTTAVFTPNAAELNPTNPVNNALPSNERRSVRRANSINDFSMVMIDSPFGATCGHKYEFPSGIATDKQVSTSGKIG